MCERVVDSRQSIGPNRSWGLVGALGRTSEAVADQQSVVRDYTVENCVTVL